MGTPKLLLEVAPGQCLIERVLGAWNASGITHGVVVLHGDDRELARICRRACSEAGKFELLLADPPPSEMKASIAAGLYWLRDRWHPQPAEPWLTAPADLPELSADGIDALLEAYLPGSDVALVPVHQGKEGHPALLAWSAADELQRLGTDEGLKHLLARLPARRIECAEGSTGADLDTPDDYRRLRDRLDRPDC